MWVCWVWLITRSLIGRIRTIVCGIGAPVQGRRGVGFSLALVDASPNDHALCGTDAYIVVSNNVTCSTRRKLYRKVTDTDQLNFDNRVVSRWSTTVNKVIGPA